MKSGYTHPLAFHFARRDKSHLVRLLLALSLSLFAGVLRGQNYVWHTLAGNSGYGAVNGTGTNASFHSPGSVAVDASNNVYVADSANHLIRKITADGVVTTFAGTAGVSGSSNGVGTAAQFFYPSGVALDSSNNLFVADAGNNLIRMVTPAGVVTTFAGVAGVSGSSNGVSTAAQFNNPTAVAIDKSNNVYVADAQNSTIRMITSAGLVSTLAGKPGNFGHSDGTGSAASFSYPQGLTVDSSRNVYVADTYNHTIRKIAPGAVVTTLAGMPGISGSLDATGTNAQFAQPFGVTWDNAGGLYVADTENNIIRRVDISSAAVTTYASGPGRSNPGNSDGTGSAASFRGPQSIALSPTGIAFIADTGNNLIRQMTTGGTVGTVTTLAGIPSTGTNDGPGSVARFNGPSGIAVDSSNNVFVADSGNNTIRKIDTNGIVSTFAGVPGVLGHADSSNGPATFFAPKGLAVDSANNLFVADTINHTIREITPAGVVTTFAGSAGLSGTNNGTGSAARFNLPQGVAVDAANTVYVADSGNNMIRSITPQGVVTTFAGTGVAGFSNGPVSVAQFNRPMALAVDSYTNVYVLDYGNTAIRLITNDQWQVKTVTQGMPLYHPTGLCIDSCHSSFGPLCIANFSGMDIVGVDPQTGMQTVIAGTQGVPGNTDGPSSTSLFNGPAAICSSTTSDASCPIYVAEQINNTVRVGLLSGSGPSNPPPIFVANTAANHINAGQVLCPISTFTGELYQQMQPDITLGGPLPLVFQRYYGSFIGRDSLIKGRLGENWLHNFEMTLTVTSSNVIQIVNQVGRAIQFTNSSGALALIGQQDIPYQLVSNSGGYILGDPWSQLLYTFDSSGRLTQIADGHGNAQTLSYSGTLLTNVTDGLGRSLAFEYNSQEQLTNVTDGVRSIRFTQTGSLLTASADARGNITTYSYDPTNSFSGLLVAATLPEGNAPYMQSYNAAGQVIVQVQAGRQPGTNTLSYGSGVVTITDPFGNQSRQTNSAEGLLTGYLDEAGNAILMGYNTTGQRNSVTDRLAHVTLTSYHAPSGKVASITFPDGTTSNFSYTNRTVSGITFYDLTEIAYPDGTTDKFGYDSQGNITAHIDRASQVWTFTYDAHGQPLTSSNPANGIITFTYHADETLASRQDTDTGLTTFLYDALRRLTNVTLPDTAHVSFAYDADDQPISITDALGRTRNYKYDANNNVVQSVDALGEKVGMNYDQANRLQAITNQLGFVNMVYYDARGYTASNTTPTGDTTLFAYDARQRLTAVTDPLGNRWNSGYDNEAMLLTTTNPLSQVNAVQRNAMGNITSASDPLGNRAGIARDLMQRVTLLVDPISRSNTFAYDAHDALSGAGRQGIGVAVYQRNVLGLLSQVLDLNSNAWKFAYSPMGRLLQTTDPLGRSASYSYDSRGRLQKTSYPDATTSTNSYDAIGNLTNLEYSSGLTLPFGYDALNRVTSAGGLAFAYDPNGRLTNTASSGVNYGAAFDASGRLTSASYNNGAFAVHYTYDPRSQVTNIADTLTGASVALSYDAAGRIIGITRGNGVNSTYSYDADGRLVGLQEGTFLNLQFAYDAAGQVLSNAITAPLDPTTLAVPEFKNLLYDTASQIASSGYAFDSRGRQTRSPGHSFAWDNASRLTGIDGVTLGYNGLSQVETRTAGGTTERYFYNHAIARAPIVAERNDSTGQITRYYVWTPGGQLLYLIDATQANAVSYYHFDHTGSTLALTTANGAVSDAYAYSPYGVTLRHTGNSSQPFTYSGEFGVRTEAAAGLYQMRARYYDPSTARFLSPDPVWPLLDQPGALNPYQYALRNPESYADPLGQCTSYLGTGFNTVGTGLTWYGNYQSAISASILAGAEAQNASLATTLLDWTEGYLKGAVFIEDPETGELVQRLVSGEDEAARIVNFVFTEGNINPLQEEEGVAGFFTDAAAWFRKTSWLQQTSSQIEAAENTAGELAEGASKLKILGTTLAVVGTGIQTGVALAQDVKNGAGVAVTGSDVASTIGANVLVLAAPPVAIVDALTLGQASGLVHNGLTTPITATRVIVARTTSSDAKAIKATYTRFAVGRWLWGGGEWLADKLIAD